MSDSVLYLCPFCGAFINEEVTACPNCKKPLEDEAEEEFEKSLDDLIYGEIDEAINGHMCPRCGKALDEDSMECADCDVKIEEELDLVDDVKEDVSFFLCSGCGAFISSDSEECPNCGADLSEESEEVESPIEYDSELLDLLVEKDEIDEEEAIREIDGLGDPEKLISVIDKMADAEEGENLTDVTLDLDLGEDGEELAIDDESFKLDIDEEIEKTIIVESIGEKITEEIMVGVEGESEILLCGNCGAFVSPSMKECNVCGTEVSPGKYLAVEKDGGEDVDASRDPINTETTLRKILGILDEVIIEPDPMAPTEEVIGICQACGAFIPTGDDKCPVCQADKKELAKVLDTRLPDEEEPISICGECGAFARGGAKSCNICGAELDEKILDSIQADEIIEMGKETDSPMDILKKALGVLELKDTSPIEPMSGELSLCPDCGAFVGQNAKNCSICGVNLLKAPEQDDIVIDLDDETIDLSDNVCPNCGSKFGIGAGECEVCGFTFLDEDISLGELRELESSDIMGDGDDISDIIELEIPSLADEGPDGLDERGLEDLVLEEKEMDDEYEEVAEPQPIGPAQLTNKEKLAKIEKAYKEGNLSRANYLINKAKFYGIVDEKMRDIEITEKQLDELLVDIGETVEAIEVEHKAEVEEGIPDLLLETEDGESVEEEHERAETEELEPIEEPVPEIEEEVIYEDELEEDVEYDEEYEEVDIPHTGDAEKEEEYEDYDDELEMEEMEDEDIGRKIPFRRFPVQESGHASGGPLLHSGWEYGVLASLFTSLFYVALESFFPIHPFSLAVIFGVILLFALIMIITSRAIFIKGDLSKGVIFLAGGAMISFILLHWFADIIIGNSQIDKILLSTGIIFLGIGIIWVRSKIRYIHLWVFGTIFLFLFSIGELLFFEQWAFSPVQPPGAIVAGLGMALIIASTILLAYERSLHTSIETEIVRGDIGYLNKDYNRALRSYDTALEKSRARRDSQETKEQGVQGYDVPWYSKGATLILMGQLEEGIECLDMALSINPNNEVAWVTKGNAYSKMGDFENALESYNNALIINPRYVIAWNNRGNAFAREKKYVEALKSYNRAIKLNSNYEDAWINKGYVLMKMGKEEEALKCISMISQRGKMGEQSRTTASSA